VHVRAQAELVVATDAEQRRPRVATGGIAGGAGATARLRGARHAKVAALAACLAPLWTQSVGHSRARSARHLEYAALQLFQPRHVRRVQTSCGGLPDIASGALSAQRGQDSTHAGSCPVCPQACSTSLTRWLGTMGTACDRMLCRALRFRALPASRPPRPLRSATGRLTIVDFTRAQLI
jgi:hypothetical protein